MSRGIHQVYEVRFATRVLQDQRHRRGFDGDTTISRQGVCVGIADLQVKTSGGLLDRGFQQTNRCIRVPSQLMCFQNQSVQQRRLSVMQVASDGNVSDHGGVIHHLQHESGSQSQLSYRFHPFGYTLGTRYSPSIESRHRHVLLLDRELPHLDRLNDRLRQELRVLLLNERLHIRSIGLFRCRIILFVLVKHDLISRRCNATKPK